MNLNNRSDRREKKKKPWVVVAKEGTKKKQNRNTKANGIDRNEFNLPAIEFLENKFDLFVY